MAKYSPKSSGRNGYAKSRYPRHLLPMPSELWRAERIGDHVDWGLLPMVFSLTRQQRPGLLEQRHGLLAECRVGIVAEPEELLRKHANGHSTSRWRIRVALVLVLRDIDGGLDRGPPPEGREELPFHSLVAPVLVPPGLHAPEDAPRGVDVLDRCEPVDDLPREIGSPRFPP